VDGDFLKELRAEDLRDVLGVEHELHVRKILLSRDKLLPLSDAEKYVVCYRGDDRCVMCVSPGRRVRMHLAVGGVRVSSCARSHRGAGGGVASCRCCDVTWRDMT
jgi:Na+-transporting NADH:ubiquinone oxidoreductase subunit NqrF